MIKELTFIHILTASLCIEFLFLTYFRFSKNYINKWYNNLGWTAVLLDILSLMIGFYLAKFLYEYLVKNNYINEKNQLLKFLTIVLFIQIIHDFTFYFTVIKPTKKGNNTVIDEFKDYANHYKLTAVYGDSMMYIISTILLFTYIKKFSNNLNIFISISILYIIGYLIHQKSKPL